MPKFRDVQSWQQAEILMQPAFIRLVDNIRKQLEESQWQGRYIDMPLFPEGTPEEVKFQVRQLQAELATASPERAAEIETALTELPSPFPGYQLHLTHHGREATVDVWNLCYQICFRDYPDVAESTGVCRADDVMVDVDTDLLDDTQEVDWTRLDSKAHQVVERLFTNLGSELDSPSHPDS
jgi:hypothetical protein